MIKFEEAVVGARFIDENNDELMIGRDDANPELVHIVNLDTGIVETNFTGLWVICDELNNRNARKD